MSQNPLSPHHCPEKKSPFPDLQNLPQGCLELPEGALSKSWKKTGDCTIEAGAVTGAASAELAVETVAAAA